MSDSFFNSSRLFISLIFSKHFSKEECEAAAADASATALASLDFKVSIVESRCLHDISSWRFRSSARWSSVWAVANLSRGGSL